MVMSLCYGYASAALAGPFLGGLSDLIGHKKVCPIFFVLHFLVGIWKRILENQSNFVTSVCLSLAHTVFLFTFETWMITQHEKLGHRLDSLNDTFWLMTFFEYACFIAAQVLANWLRGYKEELNAVFPSMTNILLATIYIAFLSRVWTEIPQRAFFKEYSVSFYASIIGDKRILLLAWAQSCLHFSVGIFWILWAPTVVEIGVLLTLFCIFHAGVGLISPLLARLRTMYVPNELRGGMMGLSHGLANAALLLSLVQGGYHRNVGNAALMAIGVFVLFTAAGCMHALKQCGKQPYQNWHKQ